MSKAVKKYNRLLLDDLNVVDFYLSQMPVALPFISFRA